MICQSSRSFYDCVFRISITFKQQNINQSEDAKLSPLLYKGYLTRLRRAITRFYLLLKKRKLAVHLLDSAIQPSTIDIISIVVDCKHQE